MDMGSMGGMDMGSASLFQPTNMAIARAFWYIIAVMVFLSTWGRIVDISRTYFA